MKGNERMINLDGAENRFLALVDTVETKLHDASEKGKADQVLLLTGKMEGILETWTQITGGTNGHH